METKKKHALLEQVSTHSHDYYMTYGSCPQCVLAALQDVVPVVSDDVIKAVHTISGGGALCGIGTCGALVAGMLALGAKYGRDRSEFGKQTDTKGFELSRELMMRFREYYGGITCHHIQNRYAKRTFNMWDADEARAFAASPCKAECAHLTGRVAAWVVDLL